MLDNTMLVHLLDRALSVCKFRTETGKTVTIEEVQRAFSDREGRTAEVRTTLTTQPEVEDEYLEGVVEYLADHLQQYLSDRGRVIGYPSVFVGHESVEVGAHEFHALAGGYRASAINTCSSLVYFARALLTGCARVGTRQAVEQFGEWLDGDSIKFKIYAVLNGIHVKNKMELTEGITLYELPTRSKDLPNAIPQTGHGTIVEMLGKTVMEIQGHATPAFFRPSLSDDDTRAVTSTTALGETSLDLVMMSLSLTANQRVRCTQMWGHLCETAPFEKAGMQGLVEPHATPRGEIRSINYEGETVTKVDFVRKVDSSEDDIRAAWTALPNMVRLMKANPRFDVAVNRWMEAVSEDVRPIYRLVDLRIALEALYMDSDQGELSYRLALTGARHLGTTLDNRKHIQKTLKDFYKASSRAIHGGPVTLKKIDEAVELCRDGIRKIIESGRMPSWNEWLLK